MKTKGFLLTALLLCLVAAGCSGLRADPHYEMVIKQSAIIANVNAEDFAQVDPNNVDPNDIRGLQLYLKNNALTWKRLVDALEGKESE